MKQYYIDEVKRVSDKINSEKKDFLIAAVTDTHLDNSLPDTLNNIKEVDKNVKFDCMVHMGDFLNEGIPRDYTMKITKAQMEMFRNTHKKFYPAKGNHDDSCYIGEIADKDWYEATSFIDAQQLAWLKNSALNVPEGYQVLIFSNTIPNSNYETGKDFSMYKGFAIEPLFAAVQQSQRRGVDVKCWFTGGYDSDEQMTVGGIHFKAIRSHMPQSLCRQLDVKDRGAWYIVTIDRANRKIYCTRFGAGEDREFSY